MNDEQVIKLVKDKRNELSGLYTRMDATRRLLEDDHVVRGPDGRKKDTAIVVTSNRAITDKEAMKNKLLKIQWQVVVKSNNKLPKTRIQNLEHFSDDVWGQVDEFLLNDSGQPGGFDQWHAEKALTRGRIGQRWWPSYDKDGHLVIDCLLFDMRWCPYELREWYCNIATESGDTLRAKLQDKEGVKLDLIPEGTTDLEYWELANKDSMQLYVGQKKVFEQPNLFKRAPFVVVVVPTGNQFRDQGWQEREGETFDWKNRKLYSHLSQNASLAETLGFVAAYPPLVQEKADKSDDPDPAPGPGVQGVVAKGEMFQEVPRGDLNRAFLDGEQTINADVSRGGVTDIESGNTEAPDTALLVTTVNSITGEKLKPYQDALAANKMLSMRMIIECCDILGQHSKAPKETALGMTGMKRMYKTGELGDLATYSITYRPMMNDKTQLIANTVMAAGQRGQLPRRFILENTLQVQDPDGIIRELDVEEAENIDPSLKMFRLAYSAAEEAGDLTGLDAEVMNATSRGLIEDAVLLRRQRRAPQQPQLAPPGTPTKEIKPNLQGMAALTGPGGNGGSPTAKITALTKAG